MPLLGAFDLYEKVEFVAGFTGGWGCLKDSGFCCYTVKFPLFADCVLRLLVCFYPSFLVGAVTLVLSSGVVVYSFGFGSLVGCNMCYIMVLDFAGALCAWIVVLQCCFVL
jgi:hypothetical protein